MTLNQYQKKAISTCMNSCYNVSYMLFNLQAEVGELSGKIAKAIRREDVRIEENCLRFNLTSEEKITRMDDIIDDIIAEAGDVLWQLSGLCTMFNIPLEEVAQHNLNKLADRQQRGVIDGNGDNR